MATSINYSGRNVDLLGFQNTRPEGQAQVTFSLFDDAGKSYVTTGIQKVSQRFVLGLLTEKGSQFHDPDYGTPFMRELKLGTANNSARFQLIFNATVIDIIAQQNVRLTGGEPDDEILTGATLESFSFPTPDRLIMRISLSSRSGETRTVFLPVTVPIK